MTQHERFSTAADQASAYVGAGPVHAPAAHSGPAPEPVVRRRGLQTAVGVLGLVNTLVLIVSWLARPPAVWFVWLHLGLPERWGPVHVWDIARYGTPVFLLVVLGLPALLTLLTRRPGVTLWAGVGGLVLVVVDLAAMLICVLAFGFSVPGVFWGALSLVLTVPAAVLALVWRVSRTSRPPSAGVAVVPRRIPAGAYEVLVMGHVYGPYSAEQLPALASAGQLGPDSVLRFNGGGPFPAREVPDLFRR